MTEEKKVAIKPVFSEIDTGNNELSSNQDDINESLIKNSLINNIKNKPVEQLLGELSVMGGKRRAPQLAFNEGTKNNSVVSGVFKEKRQLLPDDVIKQIRDGNNLVAAILRARSNMLSMFGNPKHTRFDIGFDIAVKAELKKAIRPERLSLVKERISKFSLNLSTCGDIEGLRANEKLSLADFFYLQCYNALSFGRIATEIVYADDEQEVFSYFRPVDVGTIKKAAKDRKEVALQAIRTASANELKALDGMTPTSLSRKQDDLAWVQVIDGLSKQVFTSKEMLVTNFFPVTDYEHNGYPVTPLDTAIASVTTITSIETYNKLYFMNGRSNKGMLIIKSDMMDQASIEDVKQQYMASINNVQNSFRVPIFGISQADEVKWLPTETQGKDGEFQYLYDQTIRNILSAFGMSPDEIPGFAHLSRGTNQTSINSDNSSKLTSQKDIGLRPLISKFERFINEELFPLIDPELSQLCVVKLSGLDAETREAEANRLITQMPISMNFNDVLDETEKTQLPSHLGANIPFNEAFLKNSDNYVTVGEMATHFNETISAVVDPLSKFRRDQYYIQHIQILAQYNPEAVRAYYATRSDVMDILQMYIKDYLDETEE